MLGHPVSNESAFDSVIEGNNNLSNISPNLMEFHLRGTSSHNVSRRSEVVVPLLHSSRESGESGGSIPRRMAPIEPGLLPGARQPEIDEIEDPDNRVMRENRRPYKHPLPKPRPFEGKGDRKIEHFLTTYEKYSKSMWGENEENWSAGLEGLLQGWALVLYRALVEQGKSYNQIKSALKAAFPGLVDPFRTKNILKLLNLKRQASEPLSVFYLRVETTISEAYPHLEGYSLSIQVRDTFLMKLDPEIATRVATYCSNRGNFTPAMVREAASMVITTDFSNLHKESDEEVLLLQQPALVQQRIEKPKTMVDLRCYICAAAWHPVSACPLYPTIFACPLCRQDPHPVTDCHLYKDWTQFRTQVTSRYFERRSQDPGPSNRSQGQFPLRAERTAGSGTYALGRSAQNRGIDEQRRNIYYNQDGNPQTGNYRAQRPYQYISGANRLRSDRSNYPYNRNEGRESYRNEYEAARRPEMTRNNQRQGNL